MTAASAKILRRALILGAACVAGLATVYLLAVRTVPGQRFEDAVLRAADRVAGTAEQVHAVNILDAITIPSVVAVSILILLFSALRRRLFLGLVAVAMIAAALVTTEVIQRFAERPILLAHGFRRQDQSFPSGHATVAMALMCAVVIVVPYRFRGPVVVVSSLWAAGVGVATVTASWHRPSDTIGADLIVVGYACAAVAVLAWWGRVREAVPTRTGRVRRGLLAGAYTAVAVVSFVVAAVAAGLVMTASASSATDPGTLLAGRSLALSGSAAVAAALRALLRRMDLGAPAADPADERSPHVEAGHTGVHRSPGA